MTMIRDFTNLPMEFDRFAQLYGNAAQDLTPAEALADALERAKIAALAHRDHEDGGTCNFDSPTFDFRAYGMSEQDARRVIEAAGLTAFDWSPTRKKRDKALVIGGFQRGQGNCRSIMSEKFHESLVSDGIPSGMYYQMD